MRIDIAILIIIININLNSIWLTKIAWINIKHEEEREKIEEQIEKRFFSHLQL